MTGKVIRTSGGRIVSSTPRSNLVTDTKFVESSVEPKSVGPPANSIVGICSPAPKVTPSPSYVAHSFSIPFTFSYHSIQLYITIKNNIFDTIFYIIYSNTY